MVEFAALLTNYMFINKMRTRPIINLNVGLLEIKLIEKCDIQELSI